MKRIIFSAAAALILLSGALVSHLILNNHQNFPGRDFRFSLPIPPDVTASYKVDPQPEVLRVFMTGDFADWASDDPRYAMSLETTDSGELEWTLDLDLDPGQNEYKFVAYIQNREDPVWVHDAANPHKVDDGFQGFNSVALVSQEGELQPPLVPLFSILAGIAFLLTLVFAVFHLVPKWRLTPQQARLFGLAALSLGFCITFITINVWDIQRTARSTYAALGEMYSKLIPGVKTGSPLPESSGPGPLFAAHTSNELLFPDDVLPSTTDAFFLPKDQSLTPIQLEKIARLFPGLALGDGSKAPPYPGAQYFLPAEEYYLEREAEEKYWAELAGFQSILVPIKQSWRIMGYMGLILNPQEMGMAVQVALIRNIGLSLLFLILIVLFYFQPAFQEKVQERGFYEDFQITSREAEIIQLIIQGASNQDIADKLYISEKTVKSHIYNIYQKTGVQNRIELIHRIQGYGQKVQE
jgi:DNA-binding CsgD family transcriptional regulator